jgi:hypothetical protein
MAATKEMAAALRAPHDTTKATIQDYMLPGNQLEIAGIAPSTFPATDATADDLELERTPARSSPPTVSPERAARASLPTGISDLLDTVSDSGFVDSDSGFQQRTLDESIARCSWPARRTTTSTMSGTNAPLPSTS